MFDKGHFNQTIFLPVLCGQNLWPEDSRKVSYYTLEVLSFYWFSERKSGMVWVGNVYFASWESFRRRFVAFCMSFYYRIDFNLFVVEVSWLVGEIVIVDVDIA